MAFCIDSPEMRFRVYEYDINNVLHDTGKEFSITIDESNDWCRKQGGYLEPRINTHATLAMMFKKLYGFDKPLGHMLFWTNHMITGDVTWNSRVWQIRRVG